MARAQRTAPSADPRDRVHRKLARQTRRFPDLDLKPVEVEGLGDRDAAFAHALDETVTRRWLTLSFLIGQALRRPFEELEPRMQGVLLAGAAQVLFMRTTPPHAATNESVEWAKRYIRPGAAGMVNAALRRIVEMLASPPREGDGDGPAPPATTPGARFVTRGQWTDRRDEIPLSEGGSLVLAGDLLPLDPMQRLAAATSNPVGLLRLLARSMPMREVRRIALHGLALPPVILNTAHAQTPLPGADGERAGGFELTPHMAPGHHVFRGPHAKLAELLRSRRDVWAQDPASSLAVQSAGDLAPDLVVDMCAGRGTKTRQLAYTFPNARIVATDIDAARFGVLADTFAGDEQVQVAPFHELEAWNGRADLVLIDAPCSNTGVLARRVEARYRADEDRTRQITGVQRQILADSVRLLADGRTRGRILYSTCSLDTRENEEQARWTERWHALSVSRENTRSPGGGPGEPPENYSDGSYAALLG